MKYDIKTTHSLLCVVIFLSFISCSLFESPEKMFRLHVLDPIPNHVTQIQFYKDKSAMHGPLFFHFKTTSPENITHDIINKHNLKQTSEVPETVASVVHLPNKIAWWKSLQELKNMNIYAITYLPKSGYSDWNGRYLFTNENDIYFVTTGFFRAEEYQTK